MQGFPLVALCAMCAATAFAMPQQESGTAADAPAGVLDRPVKASNGLQEAPVHTLRTPVPPGHSLPVNMTETMTWHPLVWSNESAVNNSTKDDGKADIVCRTGQQLPDVYIEGIVGAGKSTLIHNLIQRGFHAVQEPAQQFKNLQGYNFLHLSTTDPNKWGFPFQLERLVLMWDTYRENSACPGIYERSVNSTFMFAQYHVDQNTLQREHLVLLEKVYDSMVTSRKRPELFIYLRTTPKVAHERIQRRENKAKVYWSSGRLEQLQDIADKWMLPRAHMVINGDKTQEKILSDTIQVLRQLGYCGGKQRGENS